MLKEESKTIFRFVVDSEGKLVGLLGDEDDEGCPVAFAPTPDLVGAVRLFLLQRSQDEGELIDERGLYQLALERMEMAYSKLVNVLEEDEN
jgi:hypothetical protein